MSSLMDRFRVFGRMHQFLGQQAQYGWSAYRGTSRCFLGFSGCPKACILWRKSCISVFTSRSSINVLLMLFATITRIIHPCDTEPQDAQEIIDTDSLKKNILSGVATDLWLTPNDLLNILSTEWIVDGPAMISGYFSRCIVDWSAFNDQWLSLSKTPSFCAGVGCGWTCM